MLVYACDAQSAGQGLTASGDHYPTCETGGQWLDISSLQHPVFDPAALDPVALSAAFGAGFTVLATGLVIAWSCRIVVLSIRA